MKLGRARANVATRIRCLTFKNSSMYRSHNFRRAVGGGLFTTPVMTGIAAAQARSQKINFWLLNNPRGTGV